MFITTPNQFDSTGATRIFRRHRMTDSNGRAIRPGFDFQCLTGYHRLYLGHELQRRDSNSRFCEDVAVAPLDAPEFIPAGACCGHDGLVGDDPVRHASQNYLWRE
jgi:hypothetical protein